MASMTGTPNNRSIRGCSYMVEGENAISEEALDEQSQIASKIRLAFADG